MARGYFFFVLVVAGCATPIDPFTELSTLPTPPVWDKPGTWSFQITGLRGEGLGGFDMHLTGNDVETCSSGDWKRAKMVSENTTPYPLESWYNSYDLFPAYMISGQMLLVQLNAPICDDEYLLRGHLNNGGAGGAFETSTMFSSEKIGEFVAVPIGQEAT